MILWDEQCCCVVVFLEYISHISRQFFFVFRLDSGTSMQLDSLSLVSITGECPCQSFRWHWVQLTTVFSLLLCHHHRMRKWVFICFCYKKSQLNFLSFFFFLNYFYILFFYLWDSDDFSTTFMFLLGSFDIVPKVVQHLLYFFVSPHRVRLSLIWYLCNLFVLFLWISIFLP